MRDKIRLGILVSHPIQYYATWFRTLAKETDLCVCYAHQQTASQQAEAGFGVPFEWDIDLLSGYRHIFLQNISKRPSVNHFMGCDTPDIARQIASEKFDVFIVTGWYLKSFWQAIRACRKHNIPVLVRGDSQLLTPQSKWKSICKKTIFKYMLNQFDGFLVVGKRYKEYLHYYGVKSDKMFSAPHCVDNEWFSSFATSIRPERIKIRAMLGAKETDGILLFVGKLIPKKRPQDLLEALRLLKDRNINVVGVFVGSGEMQSQLRQTAINYGVEARFEGFKNQTELPQYYVAADVLVLPSDGGETWGLVVNEAMACGLPAIVSDAVGCSPDLIEEGITGFSYQLGNIKELAERIEHILAMLRYKNTFDVAIKSKMDAYSIKALVAGTIDGSYNVRKTKHSEH